MKNSIEIKIKLVVIAVFITAGSLQSPEESFAQPNTVRISIISDTQENFTGILDNLNLYGFSVTSFVDLDSDGINDIVVVVDLDDNGRINRGAKCILFLKSDGTVKSIKKVENTEYSFENQDNLFKDFDVFYYLLLLSIISFVCFCLYLFFKAI